MSTADLAWRCAIALAGGVIYWGGVCLLGRRVRRRIGRAPNLRPRGGRERLLWLGWLLVGLMWVGLPLWGLVTGLALFPTQPWSFAVGTALTVLGYAGTLWCYRCMGAHWRIFIDPKEKNALIRTGPYRRVRHPIYAFQSLMLLGAFFLLPSWITLLALVLQLAISVMKLRDEEIYLTGLHGEEYRQYRASTGALTPWL